MGPVPGVGGRLEVVVRANDDDARLSGRLATCDVAQPQVVVSDLVPDRRPLRSPRQNPAYQEVDSWVSRPGPLDEIPKVCLSFCGSAQIDKIVQSQKYQDHVRLTCRYLLFDRILGRNDGATPHRVMVPVKCGVDVRCGSARAMTHVEQIDPLADEVHTKTNRSKVLPKAVTPGEIASRSLGDRVPDDHELGRRKLTGRRPGRCRPGEHGQTREQGRCDESNARRPCPALSQLEHWRTVTSRSDRT